jgi:hypothetical protein
VTLLLEKIRVQRAALAAMRTGTPATAETLTTVRDLLHADEAMAFGASRCCAPRQPPGGGGSAKNASSAS